MYIREPEQMFKDAITPVGQKKMMSTAYQLNVLFIANEEGVVWFGGCNIKYHDIIL